MILGLAIGGVITISALSIWAWKSSRQPKDFVKAFDKPFQGTLSLSLKRMRAHTQTQ